MESPGAVPHLWVVRDPEPLGSLLRPFLRDFPHLANLIASGQPTGSGVIIDGRYLAKSAELREAAATKHHEIVLDSLGVEIAAPSSIGLSGIKELPWLPRRRSVNTPLAPDEQQSLCESLAEAALSAQCTAVLAPTRFIQDIQRDEVTRDVEVAVRLREALDAAGGSRVRVYYPLVAGMRLISSETARQGILTSLRQALAETAIDAIWIRAVGFDVTSSGPVNLRRYVSGVRGLHQLGLPVVGDRAGTLGLAMLALGVTSSITSGITMGERYDPRPLFRVRRGPGFLPAPRVYVPAIGALMGRERASALLKHASTRNWFACQRSCCSARGTADTLSDPRRHFVVTRSEEVADLARVPEALRASQYMETWLRPATDRAAKAMRIDPLLEKHRDRMDAWRVTLGAILDEDAAARPQASRSVLRLPTRMGA